MPTRAMTGDVRQWAGPTRIVILILGAAALVTSCGGTEAAAAADVAAGSETNPVPVSSATDRQVPPATATSTTTEPTATTVTVPLPTTSSTTTPVRAPILLPDLVGRTETEAKAALSALGFGPPSITSSESEIELGIIVSQVPAPGQVASGRVKLVVSVPVTLMPDFTGVQIAEVIAWADPREINVTAESLLTLEFDGASVIDQLPGPGERPGTEIVLTIAETPLVLLLTDLEPTASDDFGKADLQLNGAVVLGTNYFDLGTNFISNEAGFADFDLSGEWVTLTMTLGIDDTNDLESEVVLELSLDGQLVLTETVVFGSMIDVVFNVTDVVDLRITATAVMGGSDIDVALVNAQLVADHPPAVPAD